MWTFLFVQFDFTINLLKEFKKIIKEEKPDLYICHLGRMEWYLKRANVQEKSIIEMTDALSITYSLSKKSSVHSWKYYAYKLEQKRLERFEDYITLTYKKVVLVSESDKDHLKHKNNVYIYPNGIRFADNMKVSPVDKNKIVFVGNLATLQNQDAVVYFIRDIFPNLKKLNENFRFYIVGANPDNRILSYVNNQDIFATGFVDSIEEFIKDALVSVVPIRIAAGIQNKVLISMASKVPVVLSQAVFKGIPTLENKKNCFICSEAEDYVRGIELLMNDDKLRLSIAENGNRMVQEKYDWNAMLEGYESMK